MTFKSDKICTIAIISTLDDKKWFWYVDATPFVMRVGVKSCTIYVLYIFCIILKQQHNIRRTRYYFFSFVFFLNTCYLSVATIIHSTRTLVFSLFLFFLIFKLPNNTNLSCQEGQPVCYRVAPRAVCVSMLERVFFLHSAPLSGRIIIITVWWADENKSEGMRERDR